MLLGISPASGEPDGTVRRWFGAEGGFEEIACFGVGTDCPGFSVTYQAEGQISTNTTGNAFVNYPETGTWPARTGNRLFLAGTPGGTPGFAFLSTQGSDDGPVRAGTISFAFRVHDMPAQPVVIFRHDGELPGQNLLLTLLPNARLALAAAGFSALTDPITDDEWHVAMLSYGAGGNAAIKLYIDDLPPITGTLPAGGPEGNIQLGIVSPTPTRFVIGIDDYAESASVDAPIRGARVDYLMPLGQTGNAQWAKSYGSDPLCESAAKNWQFVSEDQYIVVAEPGKGAHQCNLGGGAVVSTSPGRVDTFVTEGIPSGHSPSGGYRRNLSVRPGPWEPVLGVRLRIRGRTDTANAGTYLGYLDGGVLTSERFALPSESAVGYLTLWGENHPRRASGAAWEALSLAGAMLQLNSGPDGGTRWVTGARLDYVWIPDDVGASEVECVPVCG